MLQFPTKRLVVIGIILIAEQTGGFQFLSFVVNDVDSSKGNHTAVIGGVLLRLNVVLRNDAEGGLVTIPNSIDLVTTQCAVEIQLSIGKDITDGDGIGITSIAQ